RMTGRDLSIQDIRESRHVIINSEPEVDAVGQRLVVQPRSPQMNVADGAGVGADEVVGQHVRIVPHIKAANNVRPLDIFFKVAFHTLYAIQRPENSDGKGAGGDVATGVA